MRSLLSHNRLEFPKTLLAFLREILIIRHFVSISLRYRNYRSGYIVCYVNKTN